MKLSSFRSSRHSGFTLVELLVVIGIIAILAAATIAGVSAAMNAAKRAKASAIANQIQTAVMNYDTEYSVYPVDPSKTGDQLYKTAADWGPMMVALCGGVDPGNPTSGQVSNPTIPNTRQIVFLTPNKSDLDTTATPAVLKNPFSINGTTAYFYMAVDDDYSNIVGDSGPAQDQIPDFANVATSDTTTLPTGTRISGGVAVWANCDPKTGNGGTPTNPKFWVHTY